MTDKDDEENATAPLLTLFGCKKGSEQIGAVCGGAQTMINICKNSSLYNAYCSPQTHIIVWHEHQYWCKPSILNFTCLDHRKSLKLGIKVNVWKWKPFYWRHVLPSNKICSAELSTDKRQCNRECYSWSKRCFLVSTSSLISLVDFFFKLITEYLVSASELSFVCPLVTQLLTHIFYRLQINQWVAPG